MLYLLVNHAFLFSAGDLKKEKKTEIIITLHQHPRARVAPPLIV
jgi:hypothetical protein